MPTANHIIYSFRNILSGGKPTRDRGFSDRQILYIASICRNFLIYADTVKRPNQEPNMQFVQNLGCCELETVDQSECANYSWGTDVKRFIIPPVLDLPNNAGLTFVGLIDQRTRIYLPDLQYGSLDDHVPFKKKNRIFGYQIGRTLYIIGAGAENLCVINVQGIFSDPTFVNTYGSDYVPRCFDMNNDYYPIPAHLESAMFTKMFQDYAQIMKSAPEDIRNNELREAIA